jgi:protein TonB
VEQVRVSAGFPWRALALSAVIHALLLSALTPWLDSGSAGVAPRTALQAKLRAEAAPVVAPVAVPREPTFAAAPRVVQPSVLARTVAVDSPAPMLLPSQPAVAHAPEPGGVPQAVAAAGPVTIAVATAAAPLGPDASGLRQFRLALAGEARRFRSYPEAARRAGLSGTAEVRVTVEAGGAARSAELSRSSGHAALDAAALEMLSKAAPRAPLPESLRGQSFAVLLPVMFEVEE